MNHRSARGSPPEVLELMGLAEQAGVESGGAFAVRRPGPGGAVVLDPNGAVEGWALQRVAVHLGWRPATDVRSPDSSGKDELTMTLRCSRFVPMTSTSGRNTSGIELVRGPGPQLRRPGASARWFRRRLPQPEWRTRA